MSRINRPDTLLTELRDLKRRLRLLEAGRMRPPTAALLGAAGLFPPDPGATAPLPPLPLLPTRPSDWPGTASERFEPLLVTWAVTGSRGASLALRMAAGPDTVGEVRVLVDGRPVGDALAVTEPLSQATVEIEARDARAETGDTEAETGDTGAEASGTGAGDAVEIGVEARRVSGTGTIRVAAFLSYT